MLQALTTRLVVLLFLLPVPASAPIAADLPSTRIVPLWHVDVPTPRWGYAYALTANDLLVRTSQGVLALRTSDGRVSWRHRLTTSSARGLDVASGTVVIDYYQPHARVSNRHQLIALSSATGKQLWRKQGWSLPPGWRRSSMHQSASPISLAWNSERRTLAGVVTGTGHDQWAFRVPIDCTVSGASTRTTDVVVLLTCGRLPRLLLLNAQTGRIVRSISLPKGGSPTFQVSDGLIAVFDDDRMSLYDDLGRAVVRRKCWPQCAVARDGNVVLTTHHSGDENVLAAVSWPGGAPLWQIRPAPEYAKLLDGGIAARATGRGGFPVIDVIDTAVGAATSYSLPIPATTLAVAGQRIYTGTAMRGAGQTRSVRISALRRVASSGGAPLLGGVNPGQWPNACTLSPHESFSPTSPQKVLSGLTMPKPVSCRYTQQDASMNVRIIWVAGDSDEASYIVDMTRDVYAHRTISGVGDEATADASLPSVIIFRVGRVVASVTSGHLPIRRQLTELAESVAARIRNVDNGPRTSSVLPPAPPQRLRLENLPGTRVTLVQYATVASPISAYLVDGQPYIRDRKTFTRLDITVDALSPNGAWGVRTAEKYPSRGHDMVTILDTTTRSVRQIPTVRAPMGVAFPVWSPDGKQLLLTATDRATVTGFVIINMHTMKPRFVQVRDGDQYSGSFRWGGDSTTVAVQSGSADDDPENHLDVTFFDAEGREKRRFRDVGTLLDQQNWLSPSGQLFTTRCLRPTDRTCVWRTANGAPAARIPIPPESFISWYAENRILSWLVLSSEEQAVAVTNLHGQRGDMFARTRGRDGLELVINQTPS